MPVALAAAARTPFAIADGLLARWHPVDLAAGAMNRALETAGMEAAQIDEVVVGCSEPVGAQGAGMARAAVLTAGWPESIGGLVIDGAESSGSAALHAAAAMVAAGSCRVVCVVGVSSSSMVQPGASALGRNYGRPWGEGPASLVADRGGLLPGPRAAEMAALTLGITREAQDEWARQGHHRRSRAAAPSCLFAIDARPGDSVAVQRGTPVDTDAIRDFPDDYTTLSPAFDPSGTITSATFAPAADGVTALILSRECASPVAHLVGVGRRAGDPLDPIGGLASAANAALAVADLRMNQVDHWSIVEPTAAAALLACGRLGVESGLVNPLGGTLAVGDAGAAEDLRQSVDALHTEIEGQYFAAVALAQAGTAVSLWRRP